MFAEIVGPDILIILVVLVLLFGGSQLPKLARSLGSAKHEFEKGQKDDDEKKSTKPAKKAVDEADSSSEA